MNRLSAFLVPVVLVVALSACGATASPTAVPAATTPAAAAAGQAKKVDANKASIDELTAALTANGVPNAARWAREVDEYRPYPTNDPNLAKLRQNLAKYNPGQDVVDKIVATLSV
jgi:hypothetical protein